MNQVKMLEYQLNNILFPTFSDGKIDPMQIDEIELRRVQIARKMNQGATPSFAFCLESLENLVQGVACPPLLSERKYKAISKIAHYFISSAIQQAENTIQLDLILRTLEKRPNVYGKKMSPNVHKNWVKYAQNKLMSSALNEKTPVARAEMPARWAAYVGPAHAQGL